MKPEVVMDLAARIADLLDSIPRKMRGTPNMYLDPLISDIPGSSLIMVEVGSFTGESTEMFAKSGKFSSITAVDAWDNSVASKDFDGCDMSLAEQLFVLRTYRYPCVRRIRNLSTNASFLFDKHSIDFIYIDADHEYESVYQDILHWLPKVRPGGFIGGHDYNIDYPGVKRAVLDFFDNFKLYPDASWMVRI